jgi:hypothetical protein
MINEVVRAPTETYRCLDPACGFTFKDVAGPRICLKCGGYWLEWVSFNEWDFVVANLCWWKPRDVEWMQLRVDQELKRALGQ